MDLKERISEIIAYSELSLSEFADEIEVQRSSISHVTSGRNKPSLDFLIKIKNHFPEIKWEWLIEGIGDMLQKVEEEPVKPAIIEKPKPATLPDLFSLINDDGFGITESEDTIENQNARESKITEGIPVQPKILDSQQLANTATTGTIQSTDNEQVTLNRIVLFYNNGKFETFEPS